MLDGQAYTISPLSMSQVKQFAADQTAETDVQGLQIFWRKFLCIGLNNAGRGQDGFIQWTEERIAEEFDLDFFNKLREELLAFSGLRLEKKDSNLPGEVKAAS